MTVPRQMPTEYTRGGGHSMLVLSLESIFRFCLFFFWDTLIRCCGRLVSHANVTWVFYHDGGVLGFVIGALAFASHVLVNSGVRALLKVDDTALFIFSWGVLFVEGKCCRYLYSCNFLSKAEPNCCTGRPLREEEGSFFAKY